MVAVSPPGVDAAHGTTAAGTPAASDPFGDGRVLGVGPRAAGLDVDLEQPLGRAVPAEQRSVLDRPAAQLLPLLGVEQQRLDRQRPDVGVVAVDEEHRPRRRPWAGRRRRRPRRGSRTPAPRRRPARTTPSATAPRRGRPRGTSRPARVLGTGGTNRTWALMPSPSASSCSPRGCARPDPHGPPSTATTSSPAQCGCRASSSAAALTSTSGALSGWIRPTKSSTLASWGSPTAARAARDVTRARTATGPPREARRPPCRGPRHTGR